MGVRADKGRALTRYLTGTTGIPQLSWAGLQGTILSPPPYRIDVTTSRTLDHWHALLRKPSEGLHMAIRYDYGMGELEDAWVGMRINDFAPLLAAHYESISARITTHIQGD